MDRNIPIAHYLQTAVKSGYFQCKEWENWADRLIIDNDEVESWIYDVSCAKSESELYMAIQPKICQEFFTKENMYSEPDIIIGYYYLLYKENRISIQHLLSKLNDDDDDSSDAQLFHNKRFKEIVHMLFKDVKYANGKEYMEELLNMMKIPAIVAKKQQMVLCKV